MMAETISINFTTIISLYSLAAFIIAITYYIEKFFIHKIKLYKGTEKKV